MSLNSHEQAAYWRIVSKLRRDYPGIDGESRVQRRTSRVGQITRYLVAVPVLVCAAVLVLISKYVVWTAVALVVMLVAAYAMHAPVTTHLRRAVAHILRRGPRR